MDDMVKVLLIEDDPADARRIREKLCERGSRFEVVESGRLAAGLAALSHDAFDLVLLDLMLPDSGGVETFLSLRNAAPDTPVIVLSGHDDLDLAARTVQNGALDYLVKETIDAEFLTRLLRHAQERKRLEDTVRHLEAQHRRLLDSLHEGVISIDLQGGITEINARLVAILGYAPGDLIGSPAGALGDCFRCLNDGESGTFEAPLICRDGSSIVARITASPITDASGKHLGFCAAVLEVPGRSGAGEMLPGNEEQYRLLVDGLNEGIWVINEAATTTFVNPRMVEILGYPEAAIIGRPVFDFVDEASRQVIAASLHRRRAGLREQYECTLIRSDGVRRTALMTAAPLIDGDGLFRGSLAGVVDITERKNAEQQMRGMEKAIASSVSPIAFADLDGNLTYANPAFLELWGYASPDEVVGRALSSFWEDASEAEEVSEAVWGEGQWTGELVGKRRDGSTFDAQISSNTVTDDFGEPIIIMVSLIDISERKRAEREILTRNKQLMVLNRIIGSSASSLSLSELLETGMRRTLELMEFDIGIVYMLDAERKRGLLQYQENIPASVLSRHRIVKVHHWPFNFIFIAGQARYIESSENLSSIESAILEDLGAVSLACIPLIAESVVVGALYLGSKTEPALSAEEKALLEAIGKEIGSGILKGMLHKRLEAANREANLYLDIMTHDIRNAENVSTLYADLLIDMLDGEGALYAKKLQGSIRKSIGILRSVSTIRRIHQTPAELRAVDLDRVIREERRIFPGVAIAYEGSHREVWADDLIGEVFGNLIGNSIKFGGSDVEIVVRVDDYDGESLLVSIEDTGPGVPDAMKETIFHRFERGRSHGSGEGLGLYIAKSLIERYGGKVWVDDRVDGRPDLGAAFRFTLQEVVPTGDDEVEDDEYPPGDEE
ncbi:hybrid sensor histidine kinase/response regulator [Methanoculleus taiwanensis]|uniref:hybrid sensor histidine kinase/response regulator n=1 Tax=Methanoculleus taiwanensis TaxID=1550565 RepID=UPI0013E8B1D4|nr:PAS domain S-box protein [Methanoculleus taiwanensis]